MAFSKPENQVAVSATKLLTKSMISAVLCAGSVVCAEAQDVQTTETSAANTNPLRTTESHTQSGNRSMDKQRVEVLGPDGRYVPATDTEKETVRVNDATTRTVVRIYRWDANGQRKLTQVMEEEARNTASGDAQTVRRTSSSDANGNLQVVRREVADTKKASPDAQETKTTVYLADGNGGFTASLKTQELQKRSADHRVEVRTTTLQPDGNGSWEVREVNEKTIKEDGKNRTTEERVSRPNSEGKLSEVSRTIGEETETPAGESSNTVDTYSMDVPGLAGDGRLHLNQRVKTLQKKDSNGETTEQQFEQPNLGNLNSGLQARAKTKYIVRYSASGTQQTKTIQVPDGQGKFNVVSVETRKSDQVPPAQVPKTPSDKPQ